MWTRGKHHTEETKRKISEALKGEKSPWYGKHLPEEFKKKLSKKICKKCHTEFHKKYGRHNNTKEQLEEFLKK